MKALEVKRGRFIVKQRGWQLRFHLLPAASFYNGRTIAREGAPSLPTILSGRQMSS